MYQPGRRFNGVRRVVSVLLASLSLRAHRREASLDRAAAMTGSSNVAFRLYSLLILPLRCARMAELYKRTQETSGVRRAGRQFHGFFKSKGERATMKMHLFIPVLLVMTLTA